MSSDSHITTRLPVLMTPNEVANALRISMAGVYRLVDKRILPFHKVGRGLRFTEQDIATYLASNRVESIRRM
jgi:excisionase family DNA binding protein